MVVAHVYEAAVCYLKSRIEGMKSHQGQLLGVARKGADRMIPLGQLADALSFLLCPRDFLQVTF